MLLLESYRMICLARAKSCQPWHSNSLTAVIGSRGECIAQPGPIRELLLHLLTLRDAEFLFLLYLFHMVKYNLEVLHNCVSYNRRKWKSEDGIEHSSGSAILI
jgi:hypothetical protein